MNLSCSNMSLWRREGQSYWLDRMKKKTFCKLNHLDLYMSFLRIKPTDRLTCLVLEAAVPLDIYMERPEPHLRLGYALGTATHISFNTTVLEFVLVLRLGWVTNYRSKPRE